MSEYPDSPWSNRPNFASKEYHEMLHKLKMTRRDIPVKCVAVWDTVGSLGLPSIAIFPQKNTRRFAFVDTRVEDNIEFAFHALGLDEKRKSYAPTVWFKPKEQEFPRLLKQTWFRKSQSRAIIICGTNRNKAGVHSDIGGSYTNDDIANVTLSWMIGHLEDNNILTFNHSYIVRQVHRTIQHHTDEEMKLERSDSSERHHLQRTETFGPLREWGLGKIHDSYTPFFRLGGSRIRTPMEHAEISRTTMKPTGKFLQGTGEAMHASVRVRMALGGAGYNDKGTYESDALHGWKFEWEAYAQPDTPWQLTQPGEVGKLKNVEWVKFVEGVEIARMPEDRMTRFEREVLRHWTAAEDGWEEGADEREALIDSARPMRRESSWPEEYKRGIGRGARKGEGEKETIKRDVSSSISEESETRDKGVVFSNPSMRRRPLSIRTDVRR